MTFATNVLLVLGAAVVLLVIVCLGLWAVDLFAHRVINRWAAKIEDAERARIALSLQRDSCWFSEDPPTMNLVMNLARSVDVSDAREQWRRERTTPEAQS